MRVLIVDDDFFILTGMRKVLERDYQVKTMSDGESAVKCAESFDPDVVFVDYLLSWENGIDVIRKLRERCPTAHLILMTEYRGEELISEAFAAGGDSFLAKDELALALVMLDRIQRRRDANASRPVRGRETH